MSEIDPATLALQSLAADLVIELGAGRPAESLALAAGAAGDRLRRSWPG